MPRISKFRRKVVLSVSTIKDVLVKDGKEPALLLIKAADRPTLDRYTEEIAGRKPHTSHPTENVRDHLSRWAEGETNWWVNPPPPQTKAETPKEDVMKKKAAAVPPKSAPPPKTGRKPSLAALGAAMPTKLVTKYKGRELVADVTPDGSIVTTAGTFTSPSSAANAFADKTQDGWIFWKYVDSNGKRHPISGLREK